MAVEGGDGRGPSPPGSDGPPDPWVSDHMLENATVVASYGSSTGQVLWLWNENIVRRGGTSRHAVQVANTEGRPTYRAVVESRVAASALYREQVDWLRRHDEGG